jgi:hypothetical protein
VHVCAHARTGLATLNTLLGSEKLSLISPALSYYAQCRAMHLGFTDLFLELADLIPSPTARWSYCFRCKRGLRDTSVAGSFGKDRAYLEGAIRILEQRANLDFILLHAAKVSLEDYHEVKRLPLHLPTNLRDTLRPGRPLASAVAAATPATNGFQRSTRGQRDGGAGAKVVGGRSCEVRVPLFLRCEHDYLARLDAIAACNGVNAPASTAAGSSTLGSAASSACAGRRGRRELPSSGALCSCACVRAGGRACVRACCHAELHEPGGRTLCVVCVCVSCVLCEIVSVGNLGTEHWAGVPACPCVGVCVRACVRALIHAWALTDPPPSPSFRCCALLAQRPAGTSSD